MLNRLNLTIWTPMALALASFLFASAQGGRNMGPETRAQLRIILAHLESALAEVEEGDGKDSLLGSLANLRSLAGASAEAQADLESIRDQTLRDYALERKARAEAEAGEIASARETARKIQDHYTRGRALGWIAMKLAATGEVNEAVSSLDEIEDRRALSEALQQVGVVLARRGLPTAAEATLARAAQAAHELERPDEKFWLLLDVARAQKWAEQEIGLRQTLAWAEEAAEGVESESQRERMWAGLAAAQAELGLEGEAYVTEGGIEEPTARIEARGALARQRARSGDPATAQSLLDSLREPATDDEAYAWGWALEKVVLGHLNSQDVPAALAAVNRMPAGHPARAHSLARVARAQEWSGLTEAGQTFQQAIEAARQVEEAWMKGQALRIVAVELAHSGHSERGLQVAREIEVSHERKNAFWGIAHAQARQAGAAQALSWVLQLDNPAERGSALVGLAYGLIDFERFGPPRRPRQQPP